MEVARTYLNGAGNAIRIDRIYMERRQHHISDGVDTPTYARKLFTTRNYGIAGGRQVASILVEGDFDNIETATGNYTWATWEYGGTANVIRCSMSDLPSIGDLV